MPSTAGLVCEACVREGCPASTGARLGDAAIAATHSSSAGARTEDACRAPHLTSLNAERLWICGSCCRCMVSDACRQVHAALPRVKQTQCPPEQSFDAAKNNQEGGAPGAAPHYAFHVTACHHTNSSRWIQSPVLTVSTQQDKLRDAIHCSQSKNPNAGNPPQQPCAPSGVPQPPGRVPRNGCSPCLQESAARQLPRT